MKRWRWCLAALCLATGGLASAAPATLTLAAGPGTPLSPLALNGFNYGNWMPVVEARPGLLAAAPSSLRFPGGNVGDENDLIEQALQVLKTNAELLTVAPPPALIVQTRVFASKPDARNRPEDAADAARSARRLGLTVTYWEIGNEPDLYATSRNDPSWTPQRYCQVFRQQRAAILAVDPAARFAGPAVSGGIPRRDEFLSRFVKDCGDVVDLLTWHEYPTDGTATDEAALASVSGVTDDLRRYRALLADPQQNPLGHARDIRLGVTEYSLSYRSDRPRHLSDQLGALWAAEATLRLAEGGVDLTSYFALQATGGHGLVDLAGIARPSLYAFEQLAHFRGNWLALGSDDPALWTHAALQGPRLTVLVTNTATSGHALATPLPGYQLIGAKTFTQQTVDDEADFTRLPLGPSLDLPARSLTRLAYTRVSNPQ